MKKIEKIIGKAAIAALLCLSVTKGQAQSNNPLTQFYKMPYLYNPAFAGKGNSTDIHLGTKQQWTTFEEAPKGYLLGANTSFGGPASIKVGLSGNIIQQNYGVYNSLEGGLSYAVHVPLTSKLNMAMGIATKINKVKADEDDFRIRNEADPFYQSLINSNYALNYFNLDAGLLIYSDQFFAGYSTLRLARTRLGNEFDSKDQSYIRHTGIAGYTYKVNSQVELIPSLMLQMEASLPTLYSANIQARFKEKFSAGAGVGNKAASILLGYSLNDFISLNYAYDMSFGEIKQYNSGSHEIILSLKLNKKQKKAAPAPVVIVETAPIVVDTDKDGIEDKLDECPNIAGTSSNKGCPEKVDADKDGIVDEEDKCPQEAGLRELGGCLPEDKDKDGISDKEDKCPEVAGAKETGGCPDTKVDESILERVKASLAFENNKSVILEKSFADLNEFAKALIARPTLKIKIEGHTDNTGSEVKNIQLSKDRANAVKAYLIKEGIVQDRIAVEGYGSKKPLVDNSTAEGRAKNRRVEINIVD
ncbi:MAG TPA: PorP/SprF family type IX secretion system membrane protein [Cytophagales bacterium]|nr:PorP/SprF family type IX secretion system membrane protein [Cytophagales bacterium]